MANNDPQYVRLANRILAAGGWTGICADIDGGSGFSVSGYDVVEAPDPEADPEAYRFVREQLRLGNLEEATAEEFNVVRDADNVMAELHPVSQHVEEGSHWPENVLASHSRVHHNRIRAARSGAEVPPRPGADEEAPKKAAGSKAAASKASEASEG